MTEDEARMLACLFTQTSEQTHGPAIDVTAIEAVLPDWSADEIQFVLAMLESQRILEEGQPASALFHENRAHVILSATAWLRYGAQFLAVDVAKELDAITQYLSVKGTADFAAMAAHLAIPLGRVWMAARILQQKHRVRFLPGPSAQWIGGSLMLTVVGIGMA